MITESKMTYQEALKVLGATGSETSAEMSRLFKRASLRNHPDRGGSNELMQKINQAYDVVTKTGPSGARSETAGDVRARYARQKKEWEEKVDAYFVVAKNYFSTKFNAQEFAEYFTKYTGLPTTFKQEVTKGSHGVYASFRFTSGDAYFDFGFNCTPPNGQGLASPDSSALGSVSVSTFVLVGTKKHKMASRDYQWGKNPDKITPESLFPSKKLESIFSPVQKNIKYKRADYLASFRKLLGADISGNDIFVEVGTLKVRFYRHVFMRKGAYVFSAVYDPAVSKYRPAAQLRGTMFEDEDGACLDMIVDTFKELQKLKPSVQGVVNAIDKMNAEFAAGHRSASFVKRVAAQEAAPKPEEKPKRTVNRIGKEEYFAALKDIGARVMPTSGYVEFDNGAGVTINFKRIVVNRKAYYSFSSFDFMYSGQKHIEWLKGIDIAEDTKGASISLLTDTLKSLRGISDWNTVKSALDQMNSNFKAGKFSAPHVKKEAEQKAPKQKDEIGAQPTKPQAAKKDTPEVEKSQAVHAAREKANMNNTIRKMMTMLVKAQRKDTPEDIKKEVDAAIQLWRLTY